jgi:hypothetical protein
MGALMSLDETLAVVGAKPALESAEPYTVAWWESRTAEELRDIINRGFAGGQVFKAANAEIERRAREETRRLRDLAAAEAVRRRRLIEIIGGMAASTLALAVLLGFWLAR